MHLRRLLAGLLMFVALLCAADTHCLHHHWQQPGPAAVDFVLAANEEADVAADEFCDNCAFCQGTVLPSQQPFALVRPVPRLGFAVDLVTGGAHFQAADVFLPPRRG